MKTVLTELKEKIEEESLKISDLRIRKIYLDVSCIIDDFNLLEEEKQQIIEAYDSGFKNAMTEEAKCDYFSQTFS